MTEGSSLRHSDWPNGTWSLIAGVDNLFIHYTAGTRVENIKFDELFSTRWLIKRPGEDWTACSKEAA